VMGFAALNPSYGICHSPGIHKTKSMEPQKSRNIALLMSLSARAMQTREEKFND